MKVKLPKKDRFTIREVARILDKHIATIWRWTLKPVRGRLLPRHHIGGGAYILREDLETFLATPDASKGTGVASATKKAAARAEAAEAELHRAGITNKRKRS